MAVWQSTWHHAQFFCLILIGLFRQNSGTHSCHRIYNDIGLCWSLGLNSNGRKNKHSHNYTRWANAQYDIVLECSNSLYYLYEKCRSVSFSHCVGFIIQQSINPFRRVFFFLRELNEQIPVGIRCTWSLVFVIQSNNSNVRARFIRTCR